ncbi:MULTISPECIES: hypothetical protein [unclassified Mesorhizobium]|nr:MULTISPECIES: hypothetical protein [unclassified Mesorhizobium]
MPDQVIGRNWFHEMLIARISLSIIPGDTACPAGIDLPGAEKG